MRRRRGGKSRGRCWRCCCFRWGPWHSGATGCWAWFCWSAWSRRRNRPWLRPGPIFGRDRISRRQRRWPRATMPRPPRSPPMPTRRGSAEYKRGDYQLALDDFSRSTGADADYNRGNALAKLGRYQDAIAAYDKSLKENPGDEDARANKAAVEALLKQQQAQQQNSNSQGQTSQKDQSQSDRSGQNSLTRARPAARPPKMARAARAAHPGTAAASGEREPGRCRRADRPALRRERQRQSGPGRGLRQGRRAAIADEPRLRRSRQSRETSSPRRPKSLPNSERARRRPTRNRLRAPRPARMPRIHCKRRRMPSGKRRLTRRTVRSRSTAKSAWPRSNGCGAFPTTPAACCDASFFTNTGSGHNMPTSINHGTLGRSSS